MGDEIDELIVDEKEGKIMQRINDYRKEIEQKYNSIKEERRLLFEHISTLQKQINELKESDNQQQIKLLELEKLNLLIPKRRYDEIKEMQRRIKSLEGKK